MNELGEYLKSLREEKKLSIRKASEGIKISHTYLDSLEKGHDPRTKKERKPTPEVLSKLSSFYNVSYIDLLRLAGYLEEAEKYTRMVQAAKNINEKQSDNKTDSVINPEKFPQPNTFKKTVNVPTQYKVDGKIKEWENSDLLDLYYLIHLGIDKNSNINLTFKNEPIENEKLLKVLEAIRLYLD